MALLTERGPCLSPDGRYLLTAGRHRLRLIDLATGTEVWRVGTAAIRPGETAVCPNGGTIIVSDMENVWLLCARTGRVLRRLWRCGIRSGPATFSPNGQVLAAAEPVGEEDFGVEVALHRVSDGRKVAALLTPGSDDDSLSVDDLTRLVFSPDGITLAAGTTKGAVLLWDVAARRVRATLGEKALDWIHTVAFSPDGKLLAAAGDARTITLWDVGAGGEVRRFGLPLKEILCLDVSSGGKTLVAGGEEGDVTVWDLTTCRLKARGKPGSDRVTAVRTRPGAQTAWSFGADGAMAAWDLETGHEWWRVNWENVAFTSAAFSPDDALLAVGGRWKDRSASNPSHVWIYDPSTAELVRDLDVGESLLDMGFSPDGGTLAVVAWDHISLWDTASWSSPSRIDTDDRGGIVAFSPDCRILAQGTDGFHVVLRDLSSGKEMCVLRLPSDGVSAVVFSPDGQRMAVSTAYNRTITVWDVASRKLLCSLEDHRNAVRALAVTPDGRMLISGGADGTIRLWDLAGGNLLATLQILPAEKDGDEPTDWIAYAPDGRFCCSPGARESIRWQVDAEILPCEAFFDDRHRENLTF